MKLKHAMRVRHLLVQTNFAMGVVESIYDRLAPEVEFVITSIEDGKHMPGSLHYKGAAFDCRLASFYGLPRQVDEAIQDEAASDLGPDYDVVLEGDHLHVEFDPKPEATS